MPYTVLFVFRDADGRTPLLEWLATLQDRNRKAYRLALTLIRRLRECGFDMRRPGADILEDGIYELRWHVGKVQYRILYFFKGANQAVLSHGITKKNVVPSGEIYRASQNRDLVETNFERHLTEWEFPDEDQ